MPSSFPQSLARAASGAAARRAVVGSRWLVVEPDPTVRASMARALGTLRPGGMAFARDGLEAIVALDARPADFVLMALAMPWMGGPEACTLLRARGHRMPIIGCSDDVSPGRRRDGLAAGMDAFLGRPLCTVQLAECVALLAGRAGREPSALRRSS